MGLINFVTGKKDPAPAPQGREKTPLFGNYGYMKHAKNTRIKDSIGFNKNVRDVHWDKLMENTGKANFKTKRGEVIEKRDTKGIVADMVKRAGYRGLSGQQIKQKLVREHGMTFRDADTIARAATYHYYEPKVIGPTWKQVQEQKRMERKRKQRNILETVIAREREEGSYDSFFDKRSAKNTVKKSFESEDSTRLGVEQRKYQIGSKEFSEGDLRGGDFRGRKMPRASATDRSGAASVAGGFGAKTPDKLGGIGRTQSGIAPLGFRKGIK